MQETRSNGAVRSGLAKKPYSARLGMLAIVSNLLSLFSGWMLAYEFLGYHARGRSPHPMVAIIILVLGLALAALGQSLGSGRNEGIRARGWVGVIDVVHIRLSFAALVFALMVLRFAMDGRHIPMHPVGLLVLASLFMLASRAFTKGVLKLDERRRPRG